MVEITQQPAELVFSESDTFVRVVTDFSTATAPSGLKARFEVQRQLDNAIMDAQEGYFHPNSQSCVANIQPAFLDILPPLPADGTLRPTVLPYFVMEQSSMRYRLRALEKFLTSPFQSSVVNGDWRHVLHGKTAGSFVSNYEFSVYIAHDYPRGYRQTVTLDQPNYLFMYCPQAIPNMPGDVPPNAFADCKTEVTVFMSNGAKAKFDIHPNIAIVPNELVAFPCGFNQLELFTRLIPLYPDPKVAPIAYHFAVIVRTNQFDTNNNRITRMIAEKSFVLDNRVAPETVYLAYDNGCGGIETQYFPTVQVGNEVEKTTSERLLFDAPDRRVGTRFETVQSETENWTVKTLTISVQVMRQLQQMLTRPVWQVHPSSHFERVYATEKSKELPVNHRFAGVFSFKFKKYLD